MKTKVFQYYMPYDPQTDNKKLASRMGTPEYIKLVKGEIVEDSGVEVDSSMLTDVGMREPPVKVIHSTQISAPVAMMNSSHDVSWRLSFSSAKITAPMRIFLAR